MTSLSEAFKDEEVQKAFRKVILWSNGLFDASLRDAVENLKNLLYDKYKIEFEEYT